MRACHLKSNVDIDRNKKVPATNQLTIGRQCLFLVHYQLVECEKNFVESLLSRIARRISVIKFLCSLNCIEFFVLQTSLKEKKISRKIDN